MRQANRTELSTVVSGQRKTWDYVVDALGRLESVTDPDGRTTTYTHDTTGNQIGIAHANGTSTQRTVDTLGRITRIEHLGKVNQTLLALDYTLDPTGRRTAIIENTGRESRYKHDELYRLVGETIIDPTHDEHTATWEYDAVSNRMVETTNGVTTRYSVDDNDRLQSHGGTYYTYDAKGNTLEESGVGLSTYYTYDSRNRLSEALTGGMATRFEYDPDGARIAKASFGERINYLIDANRAHAQVLHRK